MAENALTPSGPRAPAGAGAEKAAILLLSLGAEAAAEVFRHLSEAEVRQVAGAIARQRAIHRTQAATVLEEAWRWLSSRDGQLVDGDRFVRDLLSAGAGAGDGREQRAMRDLVQPRGDDGTLAASLEAFAPATLAQQLAAEHPQVVAVVLANLSPRQGAATLAALPEALRVDVVRRIAGLGVVPNELLPEIGQVLRHQIGELGAAGGTPVAGPRLAAALMNNVGKPVEESLFQTLDAEAPELAEQIRTLMLTFEDLCALERRDVQTLLKEVQREDLLLSLKTASPAMKEKILGNLSRQAAEILQDDLSLMGPVKLKDVEQAQANIVATARRLADEQKITIGGGGEDLV